MTNHYSISIGQTLSTAWQKVSGTKSSVWAALAVIFIIGLALNMLSGMIYNLLPASKFILRPLIQLIVGLLQIGLLYIGIKRAFDLPFNYKMIFKTWRFPLAIKIIGLYLLEIVVLLPGILLLAIPSIVRALHEKQVIASSHLSGLLTLLFSIIGIILVLYLSIRMVLGMAFTLDKEVNPWEAIKLSFAATKGNFWELVGIYILQFFIVVISAIPLGIGLIWTIPFMLILYGTIYRSLSANLNK